MVTEASKGPRIFQSRFVGGAEGVVSGRDVASGEGVPAGTRVLVGTGPAVGSAGSGEEEHAQDMRPRAARVKTKRETREVVSCRRRLVIPGYAYFRSGLRVTNTESRGIRR